MKCAGPWYSRSRVENTIFRAFKRGVCVCVYSSDVVHDGHEHIHFHISVHGLLTSNISLISGFCSGSGDH